jgi:hypothetical protein
MWTPPPPPPLHLLAGPAPARMHHPPPLLLPEAHVEEDVGDVVLLPAQLHLGRVLQVDLVLVARLRQGRAHKKQRRGRVGTGQAVRTTYITPQAATRQSCCPSGGCLPG